MFLKESKGIISSAQLGGCSVLSSHSSFSPSRFSSGGISSKHGDSSSGMLSSFLRHLSLTVEEFLVDSYPLPFPVLNFSTTSVSSSSVSSAPLLPPPPPSPSPFLDLQLMTQVTKVVEESYPLPRRMDGTVAASQGVSSSSSSTSPGSFSYTFGPTESSELMECHHCWIYGFASQWSTSSSAVPSSTVRIWTTDYIYSEDFRNRNDSEKAEGISVRGESVVDGAMISNIRGRNQRRHINPSNGLSSVDILSEIATRSPGPSWRRTEEKEEGRGEDGAEEEKDEERRRAFDVMIVGYDVERSGPFVQIHVNQHGTALALVASTCCVVCEVPNEDAYRRLANFPAMPSAAPTNPQEEAEAFRGISRGTGKRRSPIPVTGGRVLFEERLETFSQTMRSEVLSHVGSAHEHIGGPMRIVKVQWHPLAASCLCLLTHELSSLSSPVVSASASPCSSSSSVNGPSCSISHPTSSPGVLCSSQSQRLIGVWRLVDVSVTTEREELCLLIPRSSPCPSLSSLPPSSVDDKAVVALASYSPSSSSSFDSSSLSLPASSSSDAPCNTLVDFPVDFQFGWEDDLAEDLWHQLSLFVLTEGGSVWAFTPLLPKQSALHVDFFAALNAQVAELCSSSSVAGGVREVDMSSSNNNHTNNDDDKEDSYEGPDVPEMITRSIKDEGEAEEGRDCLSSGRRRGPPPTEQSKKHPCDLPSRVEKLRREALEGWLQCVAKEATVKDVSSDFLFVRHVNERFAPVPQFFRVESSELFKFAGAASSSSSASLRSSSPPYASLQVISNSPLLVLARATRRGTVEFLASDALLVPVLYDKWGSAGLAENDEGLHTFTEFMEACHVDVVEVDVSPDCPRVSLLKLPRLGGSVPGILVVSPLVIVRINCLWINRLNGLVSSRLPDDNIFASALASVRPLMDLRRQFYGAPSPSSSSPPSSPYPSSSLLPPSARRGFSGGRAKSDAAKQGEDVSSSSSSGAVLSPEYLGGLVVMSFSSTCDSHSPSPFVLLLQVRCGKEEEGADEKKGGCRRSEGVRRRNVEAVAAAAFDETGRLLVKAIDLSESNSSLVEEKATNALNTTVTTKLTSRGTEGAFSEERKEWVEDEFGGEVHKLPHSEDMMMIGQLLEKQLSLLMEGAQSSSSEQDKGEYPHRQVDALRLVERSVLNLMKEREIAVNQTVGNFSRYMDLFKGLLKECRSRAEMIHSLSDENRESLKRLQQRHDELVERCESVRGLMVDFMDKCRVERLEGKLFPSLLQLLFTSQLSFDRLAEADLIEGSMPVGDYCLVEVANTMKQQQDRRRAVEERRILLEQRVLSLWREVSLNPKLRNAGKDGAATPHLCQTFSRCSHFAVENADMGEENGIIAKNTGGLWLS